MAGGEDQNPASSSPGWTGEVMGSDKGLTKVPFWGLDGGEAWPTGVGGGQPAGRPSWLVFPAKVGPARANGDGTASRSTRRTRRSGEVQWGWAEAELRLRRLMAAAATLSCHVLARWRVRTTREARARRGRRGRRLHDVWASSFPPS
jgi:hypothetical protein